MTMVGRVLAMLFQFTPLREGRRRTSASAEKRTNFNSRPSARGDRNGQHRPRRPCISIHAPPRGATHSIEKGLIKVKIISIHAPPRGATPRACRASRHRDHFNSRPSARGDLRPMYRVACVIVYFNSRPSARGDGKRYAISANLLFNPYKSAWLNNSATQFVEIILVIFHRIIA